MHPVPTIVRENEENWKKPAAGEEECEKEEENGEGGLGKETRKCHVLRLLGASSKHQIPSGHFYLSFF